MAPKDDEDPFYVGFAISVYQNSGDGGTESNWGAWETRTTLFGQSTIALGAVAGSSCDFWNLYEQDVERAAAMGSNCFRLSLEWSRLQPGGFGTALNAEAVARYHQILDAVQARGMAPLVTLHHFVHPLWFERLGGFQHERNIPVFVRYAAAAFSEFGARVRFWATFNEANVSSFAGWIHGSFPPGHFFRVPSCGRHQLNMLRAHAAAYDAIKAMPGGATAQVGLVHNYFTFEAQQEACAGCCTPFYMRWLAALSNRMWGNDVTLEYLRTGKYDYNPFLWGLGRVVHEEPGGRPGCDWFGLNYYSRGIFDWKLQSSHNPGDVMTDMPYPLWADGLEAAVERVSALGLPIYITETGVADAGDEVRALGVEQYMAKVEDVVARGYDVRGVMWWTLVDNAEWAHGYTMKFGMFSFDHATQARTMRPSGVLLRRWFARLKASCPRLRAVGRKDVAPAEQEPPMDGARMAC